MPRPTLKSLRVWSLRLLLVGTTLLSVGVILLWVRSQARIESWECTWGGKAYLVDYTAGVILFDRVTGVEEKGWTVKQIQSSPRADATHFHTTWTVLGVSPGGFAYYVSPSGRSRIVVVPFWFLFMLTAAIPMIGLCLAARGWWKRRAVLPGYCTNCGYDLRATPDRCPECGTEPVSVCS